ncbi:DUF4265 domain-containing protein [Sediminitomix flava]|uniref:Uncharacterized protein DUF4265 n=1 Tax=Sediminitomix flava TaxID=379075 RepID=A0A315ZD43_SEDFL|nr:DUF4265 domain-containing protein [Sediminitomix flava]PWJ42768.1 uncharacterized protein DUF4265 [Sediminitomix flava]
MITQDNTCEKILFKYHSAILNKVVEETLLAQKVDENSGIFKLESIPFYGPLIATDDEFFAEYDSELDSYIYKNTTKHSGNSIVLVVIVLEGLDIEMICDEFEALDCEYEVLNDQYFAMKVPSEVDYSMVKHQILKYESSGIIEHAEAFLSQKHLGENV